MANHKRVQCEYCGILVDNRGYRQHTGACQRTHSGTATLTTSKKAPSLREQAGTKDLDEKYPKVPCIYCGEKFGIQGMTWHMKACSKIHKGVKKPQESKEPYPFFHAPSAGVGLAYRMFHDDAALFSAVCHLLALNIEMDRDSQLNHLQASKDMITLKIESLGGQ